MRRATSFRLILPLAAMLAATPAAAQGFLFPLDCTLGETCFLQQLADLDPGPDVADPVCGAASYDGHQGFDVRVLRPRDLIAAPPVRSMAAGTVRATRNGTPEGTHRPGEDCGNGIVIDHEGGWQTQYCHLLSGSIVVTEGETVAAGEPIARMGQTGRTAFPHLHVTLRRAGTVIDPFTGRTAAEGCGPAVQSLFADGAFAEATDSLTQIIEVGLAPGGVDLAALSRARPEQPGQGSEAIVIYGWAINLQEGDRLALRLVGGDGATIAEGASEPYDRAKAQALFFTGRRGTPPSGPSRLEAGVVRGERVIATRTLTLP